MSHMRPSLARTAIDGLSRPERIALELASDGLREQEIADQVHRSIYTVRSHLTNAAAKLNALNRTHTVAIALRRRLIRTERRT